MSPGRCNTGLTTPRHTEYQIINLILENYYTTHQAMPSEVPVDRWEGVDRLQFVGQAYPAHALLDSSLLKITFDDDVDGNTFVYPSENSLLEELDRSLSPSTSGNEIIPNGQPPPPTPSKLKTNTSIGNSSAGGLSTYTPSVLRTVDNFEPGMFRPSSAPPEKEGEHSEEEENKEEAIEIPCRRSRNHVTSLWVLENPVRDDSAFGKNKGTFKENVPICIV
ncbi:uncharacterized protein TNCV_2524401 [Trichonephila clavipes]|nr:uncharacterized protein TNCV_2524401 [Trichonephila clavipes]